MLRFFVVILAPLVLASCGLKPGWKEGEATVTEVGTNKDGGCFFWYAPKKNTGLPAKPKGMYLLPNAPNFIVRQCEGTRVGETVKIVWDTRSGPDYWIEFDGFMDNRY